MRTISWTALSDKGIIRLNFTPISLAKVVAAYCNSGNREIASIAVSCLIAKSINQVHSPNHLVIGFKYAVKIWRMNQLACIVQILLILECLIVLGKILIAISGHDLYYLI